MSLDQVRSHFETEAFEYDDLITKLIPKYHEQNEIILQLIPFDKDSNIKVLDLGCGTGVLSYLVLNNFPNAKAVAFDLAQNMLEACHNNLSSFHERLSLKQGNFGTDYFGTGYDLILSGLAIHHLNNPDKALLYKHIYSALSPGGIFLNREVVLGATPQLSDLYHSLWRQFISSNGEDANKWFNTYMEEDNPATVEEQLTWLKEAGFVDLGCHWRYLNYAIFGGRK